MSCSMSVLSQPGKSSMLDYVVNIYKGSDFVIAFRYEGYSGSAMQEVVANLRRDLRAAENGYTVVW